MLDVEDESGDELFVELRGGEEGEDIFKEDAGGGKVGKLGEMIS